MSEPRKYKGVYPAKGGGWWAKARQVKGKFLGGESYLGHFDTQEKGAKARCRPGETIADQLLRGPKAPQKGVGIASLVQQKLPVASIRVAWRPAALPLA